MNDPRIYRYSLFQFAILLIVAIVLDVVIYHIFFTTDSFFVPVLAIPLVLILISGLYLMTTAIMVSDTEIASRRFWVSRSLGWGEIRQVSGSGNGLKLKNIDGDVTVSLNSQLPGYEEVIEKIGQQRPDLFASTEFYVMKQNPLSTILSILMGLAFIGFSAGSVLQNGETWFPGIILVALGFILIANNLGSVQAVSIEGDSLLVKYLFKETAYRAGQIEAVRLDYQRTRNGRIHFAELLLKDRKIVRISHLRPGAAMTYLVLREWHRKQTANNFSV